MFFQFETKLNMTTTKRKKVITIETLRRTVIHQSPNQALKIWCAFCLAEVEIITPKSAARLLNVSQREVFRRIEQGNLHFFETKVEEIFVCCNSLKQKEINNNE